MGVLSQEPYLTQYTCVLPLDAAQAATFLGALDAFEDIDFSWDREGRDADMVFPNSTGTAPPEQIALAMRMYRYLAALTARGGPREELFLDDEGPTGWLGAPPRVWEGDDNHPPGVLLSCFDEALALSVVTTVVTATLDYFGVEEPLGFQWVDAAETVLPGAIGGGIVICRAGDAPRILTTAEWLDGVLAELPVGPQVSPAEAIVLQAMLAEGMECNGAETIADVIEDNMTFASVEDLVARTGMETKTVRGLLGTLTQKDLVVGGYSNPGTGAPQVVLSDTGVRVAFARTSPPDGAPTAEPSPSP